MPTKFFKVKWNSAINLTEYNVRRALRQYFDDEFGVKEFLKLPKTALNLVKNKIKSAKYNIKRKRNLKRR